MERQIYPIGEQSFRCIREEGKVYVDKTMYIPLLLENKFYFLGRPRRFGKSLFLSTLEYFFRGRRDLFRGLYVDTFAWDWSPYPVIRIDLTGANYAEPGSLDARFSAAIADYEEEFGIEPPEVREFGSPLPIAERFRYLIKRTARKFGKPAVVLVDEYEKPLLDVMDDDALLDEYRRRLSGIYSVLKSEEENLRLAFLTGVTRFGHLNIFSGINNLRDISLDSDFSAVCGITAGEIDRYFAPGIEEFARKRGLGIEQTKENLRFYYDGYHFSPRLVDIYNPFSLLHCLKTSRPVFEWFRSGSSSYLIKRLRDCRFNLSDIEGVKVGEDVLSGVDAYMKEPVTLLYQSGYLTIKAYDEERMQYTLGLPNYEVSTAFYDAVIPYYLGANHKVDKDRVYGFIEMLYEGKAREAMLWLQGFFSSIPYDVKLDYESEFQEVVYCFFALAGLLADTTLEKQTSAGRIDMVFYTPRYVYVFEFKRGDDASAALAQIDSKDYCLQWQADGRTVIKIGVAFSPATRGIRDFIIESPK